jgi:hypothetical protein
MPQNIDDTSDTCPGFNSEEEFESGQRNRVTTLTYQRLKFKLYRIAAPITRELYFRQDLTMHERVRQVQEINNSLRRWESTIPAELRPGSFSAHDADHRVDSVTRIFRLQALSLQLSYDNIQLILHRPFLFSNEDFSPFRPSHGAMPPLVSGENTDQTVDADGQQNRQVTESRSQCWESALKTSRIGEHSEILRQACNSHVAGFIGIQAFTAGVTLAAFALPRPLSTEAHEAKQGIGQLIKVPRRLGLRTVISDQSGRILEKLLRLMLAQEIRLLTTVEDAMAQPVTQDEGYNTRQQPVPASRDSATAAWTRSVESSSEVGTPRLSGQHGASGTDEPSSEAANLRTSTAGMEMSRTFDEATSVQYGRCKAVPRQRVHNLADIRRKLWQL